MLVEDSITDSYHFESYLFNLHAKVASAFNNPYRLRKESHFDAVQAIERGFTEGIVLIPYEDSNKYFHLLYLADRMIHHGTSDEQSLRYADVVENHEYLHAIPLLDVPDINIHFGLAFLEIKGEIKIAPFMTYNKEHLNLETEFWSKINPIYASRDEYLSPNDVRDIRNILRQIRSM